VGHIARKECRVEPALLLVRESNSALRTNDFAKRTDRRRPPAHMIKLTGKQEITPLSSAREMSSILRL
jgi:hypothetical protein